MHIIIITKTTLWQAGVGIGIQIPTPPLHVGMTPSNQHHESCHENLWRISVHNLVTSLQLQLQIINTHSTILSKDFILMVQGYLTVIYIHVRWRYCTKNGSFPLFKSDTWIFKKYTQGVRIDKMGGEVGRKHVARKKVIFWDLALRTKTATPPSNIPDIWHNFDIASLIDEASKTCAWNYDKIAIITVCFSFFRLIFHPVLDFPPESVMALVTNIKKVHSSTTSTPGATALFWPKSQLLGLLGTSQVLQHKWW